MSRRRRPTRRLPFASVLILLCCAPARAQNALTLDEIAARVQRVEQENAQLQQQVTALRQQLAALTKPGTAATPSVSTRIDALEEQATVTMGRLAEQDQVKVETTQRAPLRLTGMVLFNAFRNGTHAGPGNDYPGIALVAASPPNSGATMRQSVIGIDFDAPQAVLGGTFHGSLMMDLFAGTSPVFTNQPRLRTAWIEGRWGRSALLVGQDQVIVSPREPNSLAQIVFSPLIAAGNLYGWHPQVEFTQRVPVGERQEVKVDAGLTVSLEDWSTSIPAEFLPTLELRRPAPEAHVQFSRILEGDRRLEIGTGFHTSVTHIVGQAVPSRAYQVDWLFRPARVVEFSGEYFAGKNVNPLSGRRMPGVTVFTVRPGVFNAVAVRSHGGWGQATILATRRLSFNLQHGFEDPDDRDLLGPAVSLNRIYVANNFFRLAPNVVVGLEVAILHTNYKAGQRVGNTHYNAYFAYLF